MPYKISKTTWINTREIAYVEQYDSHVRVYWSGTWDYEYQTPHFSEFVGEEADALVNIIDSEPKNDYYKIGVSRE